MKSTIIILLLVLLIGCKKEMNIMKISYYSNFKVQNPKLSEKQQEEILNLVTDLISSSDDLLRLAVNDATIDQIKENETSFEIIFEEYNVFTSDKLGTEKIKKILFPLSGDFIGNEKDPVITIFLGDESYFSGPYRNYNGLEKLFKIKELVETGLN